MNIKVTLNKDEAAKLLAPMLETKYDSGYFGGYPNVSVEIVDPAAFPTFVPPPVQTRIPAVREAFARNSGGYLNKIAMIKEIRTLTGWGLKDSKDFVEAILDGLRIA